MSFRRHGVCVLCTASAAFAQTTHIVTTWGGIPAAIAAASPGDLILLPNTGTPGTDYGPFTLDKPLSIVGNGCRIGSSQQQGGVGPVSVVLAAGERALLEGLDLTQGHSPFGNIGTQLQIQGGTVAVQRCAIAYGVEHAVRVDQATVLFDTCTITAFGFLGAGAGIAAGISKLTVRDCVVTGADAAQSPSPVPFQPAQPGALLWPGAAMHAERSTFRGGSHAQTIFAGDGAPGIQSELLASGWLADVTAIGGDSTQGSGGAGHANNGIIGWRSGQTTLVGGHPGGQPHTGQAPIQSTMARLAITPPLQRGAVSTFTVTAGPGHGYGVLFAFDSAPSPVLGIFEPTWLLASAALFGGALDASGQAVIPIAVPALPPGIEVQVWFQAISGPAWLQVHVSTLAGGRVH